MKKRLAIAQSNCSAEYEKAIDLEKENQKLRKDIEQLRAMKAELARLQVLEQELDNYRSLNINPRDLETFILHKDAIRHYLKLVPTLLE